MVPLSANNKQRKEHNIRTKQTTHNKIEIRTMEGGVGLWSTGENGISGFDDKSCKRGKVISIESKEVSMLKSEFCE